MTDVLFHEVYNSYYRAAAKLIQAAQSGSLDEASAIELIRETAFSESFIYILEAIRSGQWQILTPDFKTPLRYAPKRPLSTLEKRWVEAVRLDPRMALFEEPCERGTAAEAEVKAKAGAEPGANSAAEKKRDTGSGPQIGYGADVRAEICTGAGAEPGGRTWAEPGSAEPLYRPEDFTITDQARDGDPYESDSYRAVFRTVLKAVNEQRELEGVYINGKGKQSIRRWLPYRIEYSEKDDKFRLLASGDTGAVILNLSRMKECRILDEAAEGEPQGKIRRLRNRSRNRKLSFKKRKAELLLTDDRNALERCMLHFADLEKVTTQLSDRQYRIELYYRREDETEIVIRILSFGPFLRATSPPAFVDLITARLKKQQYLNRLITVSD